MNKYPWLKIENYDGTIEEIVDLKEEMPHGWVDAFGDIMLEELDKVINELGITDEFVFEQIKEKYGRLVVFYHPVHKEISDIINKFSTLSKNICVKCGTLDVHVINTGFYLPICENCFKESGRKTDYNSLIIDKDPTLNDFLCRRQYGKEFGEKGYIEYKEDISETVEKIRKHCQNRKVD